jgi:hypothetical protein
MTLDPLHSLHRKVTHRIVEFRDRKFLSKSNDTATHCRGPRIVTSKKIRHADLV